MKYKELTEKIINTSDRITGLTWFYKKELMHILYIINSYPGNGFSFQTRSKSINGQMSIECIIAKMTNLGTELLFKSKK